MAAKLDNLMGRKFNRLTVIGRAPNKDFKPHWICKCECGNESIVSSRNLKGLKVKSCGCWTRRNKVIKYCKFCNKEFTIKKSHEGKQGVYCSKSCMRLGYKTQLSGKDNPNYRHGKSKEREYFKPYAAKRRARVKNASGSFTVEYVVLKFYAQSEKCYWCLSKIELKTCEADHVVPLARGGSNCEDNIVISCSKCNRQKSDLFVSEWKLKPNCRLKRNEYTAGKYSQSGN